MTDIVTIGLNVDSSQVDKSRESLKGLGEEAGKTETATTKLSNAMKSGIVAATALLSAALYKSIDIHREFTKAVSELSAITGATGQDLKYLSDQALLLGSTTTFAASEVVNAFKLVASAKPELLASKEALAAVTREVLTLAEASGIELASSANAVGGSLNQFGKGAEDAARFVNVLAAGAKFGASEVNETAEALKNAGAVASSLGLSFEQTNAAIQAMAAVSIKGAEAGTGLRGVLLKLSTQSREEFNPEIVGLEKALKNLADAHLSTAQKAKLFGQENITAATALIAQSDAVVKLTADLTGTNTAMEQAATNTDNLDGDIKKMGSSWVAAGLSLGETLNPALRFGGELMFAAGKAAQSLVLAYNDMGNAIGAYAAMAAAALTLDFDGIKAIKAAREEEFAANEKKYKAIWENISANKSAADLEKEAAEQRKRIAEEDAARLIKQSEAKNAIVKKEEEEAAAKDAKIKEQNDARAASEASRKQAELEKMIDHQLKMDQAEAQRAEDKWQNGIEKSEREVAQIEAQFMTEGELLAEKYLNDELKLEEAHARGVLSNEKYYQDLALLHENYNKKTTELKRIEDEKKAASEKALNQIMYNGKVTILGQIAGLMSMFAGKNKAFAIAAIAIEKGVAMAQTLISGTAAAEAAGAHAAVAGGLPAYLAARGAVMGMTYTSMGLIAATGIAQAANAADGGGGSVGTSASTPATATQAPTAQAAPFGEVAAPVQTREIRVTVDSDGPHSEGMRAFAKNLAETIKDMGGVTNLVIA